MQHSINIDQSQLILSLFSGAGLLDSGFTRNGFIVVSGPEKILGGDVRNFKSIPGKFSGIIGGPPCQDFSRARRTPPTGEGVELLSHFCRIVTESLPDWFLIENVPCVPDVQIEGYKVQRFDLSPNDLGFEQSRLRHFQFGSKEGLILKINRSKFAGTKKPCVTASEGKRVDKRTFEEFCLLQGVQNIDLPDFHRAAKYKAIGNGVHTAVAFEVARAILEATTAPDPATIYNSKTCRCGCGRILTGRQNAAGPTCRKRLQKKRENAQV